MTSNITIKSRIFLIITAILASSYALLVFLTFKTLQSSIEDQAAKSLEYSLKFAKNQFSARQETVIEALKLPAANRSVQRLFLAADQNELKSFARLWAKSLDSLEILTVFDGQHNVIARKNGRSEPDFFLKTELLHSLFERKQPITSVELIPNAQYCREVDNEVCQALTGDKGVMVQLVAVPVIDEADNVIGAIIAGDEVNREPYLPFLQQKIYDANVETIISQQGELIASTMKDISGQKPELDPRVRQTLRNGYSFQGAAAFNGRQYEMRAEPINNYKGELIGSIAVAISLDRLTGADNDDYLHIILCGLFGGAVILILGYWIARQFTIPAGRFAAAMQALEDGDYSMSIEASGSREFAALAENFNRMANSLSQRVAALSSQNSELNERNELLENQLLGREAELQTAISGYQSIIGGLFDGLVVADDRETISEINPAAERLLGVKTNEAVGGPLAKLYALHGLGELAEFVRNSSASGRSDNEAALVLKHNGRKLRFAVTALRGGRGTLLGVRDVTAEGEVERLKSGFIAKVSHELKTPLTSMKGSLQFILKKGKWLTGVEREMLTVCCRNTERLISLVSGIIELSKIEAGQIAFSMKPVQMGEVVLYALEEVKSAALVKNISLVNDVPMDLPKVFGDYERLVQVLANLLSNAVKFSPQNSVVSLSATVDTDSLAIAVADDGTVIPEEERAKLFSTFQQMGRPEEGDFCGSGLGLAICREIIERHNGSIYYAPGAGKGNLFGFSVPFNGEINGAEQDTYRR